MKTAPSVFVVMEGDYERSLESVHASEASAKAWIAATLLDRLRDGLRVNLRFADDAGERRKARRDYRARVAEVKAGELGNYRYYEEVVLNVVPTQEPTGGQE